MLTSGFNFWSEWELAEKVDFNGIDKLITVLPHVTELDIRADVWSAWVRWDYILGRNNNRFPLAMERTGLEDIPAGQTGDFYFLRNGWKLVVNMATVRVTGVLYSRDYDTAYYAPDLTAQYPAQVSSIVNTTNTTTNVITATKEDIALEVWSNAIRTLTEHTGLTEEESIKLLSVPTKEENAETLARYVR